MHAVTGVQPLNTQLNTANDGADWLSTQRIVTILLTGTHSTKGSV